MASVEKNLALNKPVYVSSTYANEGKDKTVLTDGKKDKYWSSDWDSKRTSDWVVIDLGKEMDASLIGRVLVNYKSDNTFCGDYTIQVSKTFDEENPDNGFYEIGKTKAVSWEIMQKNADVNGYVATDISDVESDMIRYLKVNMNGHATYGFQIYEIAVLRATIDVEIQGKDLTKCTLNMEEIELTFNGEEQTVPFTVTDGEVQLEEGVDFTASYKDNIDAGTATLIVTGIGSYEGEITGKFQIGTVDIESDIVTKDFSKVNTQYEYKKMEIQPIVKMKQGDYNLSSMKDFEVEYDNNLNPGTATITLRGIGNYTGTITKTFTIRKRAMSNVSIKTKFENNQLVVTVNVPDNGRTLEKDIDYTYTAVTDETGKITITITGIGSNCEGTIVKVIEAEDNPNRPVPTTTTAPKKVSVKKATIKKAVNKKGKKVKLSWKKVSGAAGYNVRYALSKKKLKKAKIKKVKKNKVSYTIKKLKKKKYFIQIRAYKVFDKKTYYGAWSKVKKVTVKK